MSLCTFDKVKTNWRWKSQLVITVRLTVAFNEASTSSSFISASLSIWSQTVLCYCIYVYAIISTDAVFRTAYIRFVLASWSPCHGGLLFRAAVNSKSVKCTKNGFMIPTFSVKDMFWPNDDGCCTTCVMKGRRERQRERKWMKEITKTV